MAESKRFSKSLGAKGLWGFLRVARWVCADDGVSGLAEGGGGGGEVEGGLG